MTRYANVDKLVKAGIGSSNENALNFYMFPHLLGHSTFSKKIADEKKVAGYEYEVLKVPVKSINDVISENFDRSTFSPYLKSCFPIKDGISTEGSLSVEKPAFI